MVKGIKDFGWQNKQLLSFLKRYSKSDLELETVLIVEIPRKIPKRVWRASQLVIDKQAVFLLEKQKSPYALWKLDFGPW